MATFEELSAKPQEYDHPKLRSWVSYRNSPDTLNSYVEFRRERDQMVFKPARLYFVAERKDGTVFSDREPWDEELNDGLIDRHFKARDQANEIERFGFMLEAKLQPLVIQYGDGFFNAVLMRYLKTYGYADLPPIAEKLARIHENKPHLGPSAAECEQRIDSVLAGCIRQLQIALTYGVAETKEILAGAIAYYLDDRYSITNREMLGW